MQKSNPFVSIIMPSYNHKLYIMEAIESILKQTYTDFELIIVDDGSTDGSYELLKMISAQDKRIRIYQQTNSGPSVALNFGISKSNGAYIATTASDDISHPQKIELQMQEFEKNPNLSAVFTYVDFIDNSSQIIQTPHYLSKVFNIKTKSCSKFLLDFLQHGNQLNASSALFSANVFKKIGFFHSASLQLQDFDFYLRCFDCGEIKIIEQPLLKYRVLNNNNNLSTPSNSLRTENEMYFILPNLLESIYRNCSKHHIIEHINLLDPKSQISLQNFSKHYLIFKLCSLFNQNIILQVVATQFFANKLAINHLTPDPERQDFFKILSSIDLGQHSKIERGLSAIKEVVNLNLEIRNLKNSTSWKLTKPLRWLSKKIADLKRIKPLNHVAK